MESGKPRPFTITLSGHSYTIRTDASEEYLSRLQQYVNDKIDAMLPEGQHVASKSALALAALSIADDYFSATDRCDSVEQDVRGRLEKVLLRIDTALKHEPQD